MSGGGPAELWATVCRAAQAALGADLVSVEGWAADAAPAAVPDVALEPSVPLAFYRDRGFRSLAVARGLVAAWRAPTLAGDVELTTLAGFADVLGAAARQRAAAATLQLAVDAARIGTWDWDLVTDRLTWDARCREIFGVAADALLDYAGFISRVHADDRARVMETVRQALASDRGELFVEYRTADGAWVEGRGRAYHDGGRAVRFMGTVVDVSGSRRAAAALRQSEAQFRTIADALPQLVLATDAAGRAEYSNAQWRAHTGLDEVESSGDGWRRVAHAEDIDGLVSRWTRALATGEPVEAEARFRRASDGEYRWMLVRALPVRDGDGKIARWLATGTDIHAQKQAERAMAAAVQVRDDFLSIAGHELKTPLTALHLQLQGVVRLVADPSEERMARVDERLSRSVASCERLMSLVDQLLDVSRMNSGRLTLDLQLVDLVEVARDTLARFEDQARFAGCELRLVAQGPARGMWDKLRVEQIVGNLVGNAVKYGSGKPVEVSVALDGDQGVVTVRDQGIGIDVLHQARIFERFERAGQDARYSGFGLGLWIVHRVVEALGGKIVIHSAPGAGATFEVRLPRGPAR